MSKDLEHLDNIQKELNLLRKSLNNEQNKSIKVENNEIKSIKELLLEKNDYFIPSYQRGYKWDKNNVTALLDDIKEFLEQKENIFYCMQPIIIMKKDNKLRVLDGQQRLTTFYILCKYLGINIKSTIEYETRKESEEFLKNIIDNSKQKDTDNIDFYYMKEAYNTIDKWFSDKNNKDKDNIKEKLQNGKDKKENTRKFNIKTKNKSRYKWQDIWFYN